MSKPRIKVNVAELEPHPACAAFPMLSDGELDKLAADIRENGQRHPIIIYSGWRILDGRNRLEACRRAGVEPIFHDVINEMESGDDDEIVRYVISTNLHRRHLDATQRGVVADKLATLRNGYRLPAQICAGEQPAPIMTQEAAADALNVSRRMVQKVRAIREKAPDLIPAMESGQMTAHAAEVEVRKRERPQAPEPTPATEDDVFRALTAELRKWAALTDADTMSRAWSRVVNYRENML